jgi:predicted porin
MKLRRFDVAAVFALTTTSAMAQGNVELYGIVDTGVGYLSNVNGHSLYTAVNGNFSPNMFGLRGREDLGGGEAAIFDLQGEEFLSTGQMVEPGVLFNRRAIVGLDDQRMGTLTIGHQTTMSYDVLPLFATPAGGGSLFSTHQGNFDELVNTYQYDNAVKYWSPSFAGFKFGGEFAFGGTAGNFGENRKYAFGLRYQSGSLSFGAVYTNENDRFLEGASFLGLKTLFGVQLSPTAEVIANNLENIGVGGSYAFKDWTVRATYTRTSIEIGNETAIANTVDASASWNIAAADTLSFGASGENFDSGRWLTLTISNLYSLSVRTGIYQQVVYQRAFGSNGVASLFGGGVSSSRSICAATLGIRHLF